MKQTHLNKSTYFPSGTNIERQSFVIDATGQRLGRLASEVAQLLMGKNRPDYTPFLDLGAHVIIVNVDRVQVTGQKAKHKTYYHYTGFPGGLRQSSYSDLKEKNPRRLVERAVRRMLPKTKLGRNMITRLRVYRKDDHPHKNLKPVAYVCASLDLGNYDTFRRVLTQEVSVWLKGMSEEEKNQDTVQIGPESYSPRRIAKELEQNSSFAETFAQMMYDFHFLSASDQREKKESIAAA
jgi:large subunit ribosomal protein L13